MNLDRTADIHDVLLIESQLETNLDLLIDNNLLDSSIIETIVNKLMKAKKLDETVGFRILNAMVPQDELRLNEDNRVLEPQEI